MLSIARAFDAFAGLPDGLLIELVRGACMHTFKPGDVIQHEAQDVAAVSLIRSGAACVQWPVRVT